MLPYRLKCNGNWWTRTIQYQDWHRTQTSAVGQALVMVLNCVLTSGLFQRLHVRQIPIQWVGSLTQIARPPVCACWLGLAWFSSFLSPCSWPHFAVICVNVPHIIFAYRAHRLKYLILFITSLCIELKRLDYVSSNVWCCIGNVMSQRMYANTGSGLQDKEHLFLWKEHRWLGSSWRFQMWLSVCNIWYPKQWTVAWERFYFNHA